MRGGCTFQDTQAWYDGQSEEESSLNLRAEGWKNGKRKQPFTGFLRSERRVSFFCRSSCNLQQKLLIVSQGPFCKMGSLRRSGEKHFANFAARKGRRERERERERERAECGVHLKAALPIPFAFACVYLSITVLLCFLLLHIWQKGIPEWKKSGALSLKLVHIHIALIKEGPFLRCVCSVSTSLEWIKARSLSLSRLLQRDFLRHVRGLGNASLCVLCCSEQIS